MVPILIKRGKLILNWRICITSALCHGLFAQKPINQKRHSNESDLNLIKYETIDLQPIDVT